MAINIRLEGENGNCIEEVIDDPHLIQNHWNEIKEFSSRCICFIDWYGDTVFNNMQMDSFIEEWHKLGEVVTRKDEKDIIDAVEKIANKCKKGVHLYLKFYGD
jgi:hypothetical protein